MLDLLLDVSPTVYKVGQVLGFLIAIESFFIYYAKKRKQILFAKLVCDSMNAVQQAMIGALTGSAINVVAIFREIVFYYRDQKKWASSILWLFAFMAFMAIVPLLTWQGPVSLLPAIGSALAVLAFYCRNPKHTRIVGVFAQSFWLVYVIVIPNYGAILSNVIQIVAAVAGLIRDYIEERKTKKQNAVETEETEDGQSK